MAGFLMFVIGAILLFLAGLAKFFDILFNLALKKRIAQGKRYKLKSF